MTVKTTKTSVLKFDGQRVNLGELWDFLQDHPRTIDVTIKQTFTSGEYGGSYAYTTVSITEES